MVDNNEQVGENPKIDSKRETISLRSGKCFKLKYIFEKVIESEEKKHYYSEKKDHFNAKWRLSLARHGNYFAFYVYYEPIAPADKSSIRTKLEFKVVGRKHNVFMRTWESCYEKRIQLISAMFLGREELEKWYFVDGSLLVEAEVSIIETTGLARQKIRKFDESQKDVSDIIIVVQDTKFYVSKMYLAAQSSFFKTLFFGSFSESSQSEIPLSGIDPKDFQCFLEVLYGESAIDDSTVEGILHIADMYATPMVVRKCEEFLLEKSKKSAKKLLEMVARYNLENLKKKCMSEINTVADIRAVLPPNIKDMDPMIMAELLEKSLSFH